MLGGGGEDDDSAEIVKPIVFKPDLYTAAAANNTEEVLKLCGEAVPPTYVHEKSGWTPLHWAAKNGNVEMVAALIEHGATAPYHRMVKREQMKKIKAARELEEAKKAQSTTTLEVSPTEGDNEATGAENAENAEATEESKGGEGESKDAGAASSTGVAVTTGNANETNEGKGADAPTEGGSTAPSQTTATQAVASSVADVAAVDNGLDEEFDEDDDDLDYDTAMERKAETSTNLLKNTPLLWACTKGYLRIVWLLLMDGYSPNDTDNLENNALHLAATAGNPKVIQVLADDGAYSTKVNVYKNLPIDMATQKECRQILLECMEKGASMTLQDISRKHSENLKKFTKATSNLELAIKTTNNVEGIRSLSDILTISKEIGLADNLISEGESIIEKLEVGIELLADLEMVQKNMPIRDQEQFSTIHKLESTVIKAKRVGSDPGQIVYAEELISKCEMEYWVCALTKRLESVECATDPNEHDMKRLQSAVHKGQVLKVDENISEKGDLLCKRLFAELGMTRALNTVPTSTKLPLKEGAEYPDDYWGEDDTGHIVETPGYPHPPVETGEYQWEPSKAMSSLLTAIANIKSSYTGAEELGANPDVCLEAKTKLAKAEKDMKILKVKDEADKALAIEATAKLCKKKGKGKK